MRSFIFALTLGLTGGAAHAQYVPDPSWEEIDFVKGVFLQIQNTSIAKRREYCGYIGRDADGNLAATEAVPGTMASCLPVWPASHEMTVIASYHTHGAFDLGYFNEIPSDVDLEGDMSLGIDGWIATPGGRLWFNDGKDGEARLVCGVACLPVSPEFYKGVNGDIAKSYTLSELIAKLGG